MVVVEKLRCREPNDLARQGNEPLARRFRAGLDLREIALAQAVAAAGELIEELALLLAARVEDFEYPSS
jgi:hypothetical protein